jgi:hypothetical protein
MLSFEGAATADVAGNLHDGVAPVPRLRPAEYLRLFPIGDAPADNALGR